MYVVMMGCERPFNIQSPDRMEVIVILFLLKESMPIKIAVCYLTGRTPHGTQDLLLFSGIT
jgi:hypothetical protein